MIFKRNEAIERMDELGSSGIPFHFFTDFKGTKAFIKQNTADGSAQFSFSNAAQQPSTDKYDLLKSPVSFIDYKLAFDQIVNEINFGNSFLVNYTHKTPIETTLTLEEIFNRSNGNYKVLFQDNFVCFSPETFIKIKDDSIYSYPMKGTIDASIENAEEKLINDPKELAEHVTIVDLIRNDLSMVANKVSLNKFRFVTEIKTQHKNLLQVSSEIKGELLESLKGKIGSILFKLLPAGSISGAPKNKTVEIIENNEHDVRNFYTGVCGYFDGKNLDSGVMIRFIEKENDQLYYRSGGGITSFSRAEKEYQEMLDKIYLPI